MPVHVPTVEVSVCPSRSVPETTGRTVFTGGSGATVVVGPESALALPPAFVAVTRTRIVPSTSAGVRSSVAPVSPAMSLQFTPAASQRSHW